jgi:hypothetical protein
MLDLGMIVGLMSRSGQNGVSTSGARHYGTPDAHCAQAPDVLVDGLGLVPLGECMQSKGVNKRIYTKYVQK